MNSRRMLGLQEACRHESSGLDHGLPNLLTETASWEVGHMEATDQNVSSPQNPCPRGAIHIRTLPSLALWTPLGWSHGRFFRLPDLWRSRRQPSSGAV